MTDQDMYIETDKIHTCNNGSQFPIVIYQGRECYKLANGTLKNCENGHIVTSRFADTKITKENSRQMQAQRYKRTQEAIREGLIKKYAERENISINDISLSARTNMVYGAIADMAGNMYNIAATGDKLQSVKAYEVVLKTGDFVPSSGKNSGSTTNIAINSLTMQQITQIQDDLGALQDIDDDD